MAGALLRLPSRAAPASPWQAPGLLLVISLALVAITSQIKKSQMSIQEVSAMENFVEDTLKFLAKQYNLKSDDKFGFRITRILKIQKKVTDHLEFHVNVEMHRTTCEKLGWSTCAIQEGDLYKKIQCYFSVFVIPWNEFYKLLKKNCSDV